MHLAGFLFRKFSDSYKRTDIAPTIFPCQLIQYTNDMNLNKLKACHTWLFTVANVFFKSEMCGS